MKNAATVLWFAAGACAVASLACDVIAWRRDIHATWDDAVKTELITETVPGGTE